MKHHKKSQPDKEAPAPAAPTDTTKYCRDCRHYESNRGICQSPAQGLSLVTGMVRGKDCENNRAGNPGHGFCGAEAAWFEVKP